MTLSEKELHTLSELAYLDSGVENTQALISDLSAIIDFVENLKNIDTHNVAPLYHPMELPQHLRDDEATEANCLEELADIAPLFDEGLYWVPKVIESGE